MAARRSRDGRASRNDAERSGGRLENYPELRQRIEQHISETQSQARRLEECINRIGSDTSTVKDAAGKMTAMMQGMGGAFAGDEVVNGAMAGYTFRVFRDQLLYGVGLGCGIGVMLTLLTGESWWVSVGLAFGVGISVARD